MPNIAKFTINASPSSPGGFDGTVSQVLTFALEGGPSNLVHLWTVEVFDANDPKSPFASKNAPSLTLVGATSGQKVNATTPGSTITTTLPGSGVHSWIVRSTVNGGLEPDHVFERLVAIKTGSGIRKTVPAEGTQYSPRGWSDVQNDLVDAGAGPLLAPGGASHAHKVAAADSAGTNLQYAADIRLDGGGTALGFGGTRAGSGTQRFGTAFSLVGLDTGADRTAFAFSGGISQVGDTNGNGVFLRTKSAGQLQILFGSNLHWLFDQIGAGPNTPRLRVFFGGDNQAFIHPEPSGSATDATRRQLITTGQDKTGNTLTVGGTLWFRAGDAQGAGGTHVGGLLKLVGGSATGGSGTRSGGDAWIGGGTGATRPGNVFIGIDGTFDPDTFNWQAMGGGIYIRNATAVPAGNPSNGGFFYVEAGALKYRGSGGTVTTVGPA